jgi:hypothetical protein
MSKQQHILSKALVDEIIVTSKQLNIPTTNALALLDQRRKVIAQLEVLTGNKNIHYIAETIMTLARLSQIDDIDDEKIYDIIEMLGYKLEEIHGPEFDELAQLLLTMRWAFEILDFSNMQETDITTGIIRESDRHLLGKNVRAITFNLENTIVYILENETDDLRYMLDNLGTNYYED